MTMAEAIARFVPDGASVCAGTALEAQIPFAAGHEIVRQRRRDLTLIGPISDVLFDMLIAAGCVARVVAAWVGNVSAGLGHAYRRAVEQGEPRRVEVEDHSNQSVALALLAGALGSPYIPTRSLLGTSLLDSNPRLRRAEDPFSATPVVLVPALIPDVTILHVQRADALGHCHCWGPLGVTREAVLAARRVIVVAETIWPTAHILSDPNLVLVPAFKVAAVVHRPWGAWPSPVQGAYGRDHAAYQEYHRASRTAASHAAWLEEWVFGATWDEVLARLGRDRLDRLAVTSPRLSVPLDYA
jgi:glutaconate CoA-transferase subunit A